MPEGRLLTASCTTGWLDWIHSQLWLLDDGLLLVKTNLARTLANGYRPTVSSTPMVRDFGSGELETRKARNPDSWIASASLQTARFGVNPFARGVDLISTRGRLKLLWLASDRPEGQLRDAFNRWDVSVEE
jgi:hypothetical protein